jgi:thiazole/oxazole-forming peptide maturase SagC family component
MKLTTVPFDIIQVKNGIVLKRGCIEVIIRGERAAQALQTILDAILERGSATKEEICSLFAAPDRQSVAQLIDELFKRRMLTPVDDASNTKSPETNLDVFYWHFGDEPDNVTRRLNSRHVVILGVNDISRQLVYTLSRSGVENFEIVDYPLFRSTQDIDGYNTDRIRLPELSKHPTVDFKVWEDKLKPERIDCIVATSHLGAISFMRRWNDFCVKNKCTFLPIVLRDLIGYVGPLVIPYETACYECFLSRRKANMEEPEIANSWENIAPDGNRIVGYHPAMASILAEIAVMELVKFYGGFSGPMLNVGKLIKLNMLSTQLHTHNVLKVPRCRVCSTMNKRSSTSLSNLLFKI